jgi:hypothetical protein
MKVFLSWSGEPSRLVAETLREWLPDVIQALKPWISVKDIDKGERWFDAIATALQEANGYGIFCVTPGNMSSPWLLFEAGALGMADRGRVVTFLHGIDASTVKPPLGLFQATVSGSQEDVLRMIKGMNARLNEPLPEQLLERAFNSKWPDLAARLSKVAAAEANTQAPPTDPIPLITEVLNVVRRIERDAPRLYDFSAANPIALNLGLQGQSVTATGPGLLSAVPTLGGAPSGVGGSTFLTGTYAPLATTPPASTAPASSPKPDTDTDKA